MRYAHTGFPITPSDTATFGATTGGIVVGSAGTLTVTFLDGNKMQLTVPVGYFPLVITQVWSTGTAASGITGLIGN